MKGFRWLSIVVLVAAVALFWWRSAQPPIIFVPIASCFPTSIRTNFAYGALRYEVVTKDGKRWRWTTRLREKSKFAKFAGNRGFFDFDGDGWEEFFAFDTNLRDCLWVFKRREAVRGESLPKQNFPSWFLLPKSQWVLWSKIPLDYCVSCNLTFITEPDPHQPHKVVVWEWGSSSGGQCLLLSRDGRRLIPFTDDLWLGIGSVEDLDHDGTCELVLYGRLFVAQARKAIYKWDGRTYRLWWIPDKRDGYLLDAIFCDWDGGGTKEIIALLDLKGSVHGMSPVRALAVYRLEHGRYHKVAQFSLPKWAWFVEWRVGGAASVPTRPGVIIALEFPPPDWRFFVRDLLPDFLSHWWDKLFCREQKETWWLVGDGKSIRVQSRWRGMTLTEAWGTSGKAVWFALESNGYYIVIASVNGRCYPVWQGKPSVLLSGDWDGDGDDELIVREKGASKLTVFKARWRR